jgi:restriction endonuclease S subunit
MRNITQDRIRSIRIPIPPFRETEYIVSKVEDMLSKSIELEEIVNKSLKNAEHLRHRD